MNEFDIFVARLAIKNKIFSPYLGISMDNLINRIERLEKVVEAAESFEYNFECDDDCQCCNNNSSLMDELRKALKELKD